MTTSNGSTSRVAMKFVHERKSQEDRGVHACTDVTGFGLVGHLLEMLMSNDNDDRMENINALLYLDSIPFFKGALEASYEEIYSSLNKENFRNRRAISNHLEALQRFPVKYPQLFDPQTSGGLLFFVKADVCDAFLS